MRGSFTFKVGSATGSRWIVTSKEIPGLLAEGTTIPEALECAGKAIRDMALAQALDLAEGRVGIQPMFKPAPNS